ncbi:MAG TPA: flagellar basal body rod C-terminal domain-containing protein, partial [Chthonomonadales bacterium]|nr:flagellar basal body rod C-terminal domain-containing protein [Chthonomonadales bacterium]
FITIQGEQYLTDGSQDIPLRGGAAAGEIRGVNLLEGYRNDLDTLASSLITAVNQLHQAGYGLDGVNNRAFFTGTGAGDIAIHPAIVADLNVIAAASPPPAGGNLASGNGDNARAIADIIQQRLLNNQTLSEYYASGLAKIGSDTRAIDTRMNHLEQMRQQLQSLRNAVSGISIDEELTLMLQYQRSYQAAARMLTVMDEVLERVINSLVR